MRAMTRREVIKAWENDDRYHDFFVCPDCRDILKKCGDELECQNNTCLNSDTFNLTTGEEIK